MQAFVEIEDDLQPVLSSTFLQVWLLQRP